MLYTDKYYSLFNKGDFTSNMNNVANNCIYTDNESLNTNQYTFLSNEECLYLKKDTSKRGYLQFNLDNIKKGDEVLVSFEYFNYSSNKIEVSLTNGLTSTSYKEIIDTTTEVGVWSIFESKFIFSFDDIEKCQLNIGLWTHLSGECKIRAVKVIHKTQVQPIDMQVKTYAIKKDTDKFVIRDDFSNSGGSLEWYNDHLILHFTPSFVGSKRPVGSVGMDNYLTSKDYIVRIGGATTEQVGVFLYKLDGTQITKASDIAVDFNMSLTFIVI